MADLGGEIRDVTPSRRPAGREARPAPRNRLRRPPLLAALLALGVAAPLAAQDVPADTVEVPPDTVDVAPAGPEVRPSEPLVLDTLAFGLSPADTIPVLAPRFREGDGLAELALVPDVDLQPKNPRNAAIRSFLVPGWGQIYTGHPWRAALFAGGEALFFTMGYVRQQDALDVKAEIREARAAFFADPPEDAPTDSTALEDLFQRTGEFLQLDFELEEARERREDWVAWGFATMIFSAVDAYAAAQLDPVEVGVDPVERRAWLGVRLPAPRGSP